MNSNPDASAVTTPETPKPKTGLRVLIVDDYADNRTLMAMVLKLKGIQILEAGDGQEGVEVACREHPDLILMDINMPIMNGFEATRQLKEIEATKQIPVLAVSANCSTAEQHQEALEVGCIDCLSKPIEWGRLQALISTLH